MIRLGGFLVSALLAGAASAGVLPIHGRYCGDDLVLTTDGLGTDEDSCAFTAVLSSGPHWWLLSQKCDNLDRPTTRVDLKGDKAVISAPGAPSLTMKRC